MTNRFDQQTEKDIPTTIKPQQNAPQANELRSLSRDPNKAMQEMMDTLDTLRGVYEQETKALKSGDVKSFMQMQEQKLFNAYQYQSDVKDMMNRADDLREKGDKNLLSAMKAKYEAFSEASNRNIEALKRMDRVMGRISERLINAARRAAMSESTTYSASGAMHGKANEVVTTGVSQTA